jgi:hypothetical protein
VMVSGINLHMSDCVWSDLIPYKGITYYTLNKWCNN